MPSTEAGDVLALRDDVEARELTTRSEARAALQLLDDLEAELRVPVVDESERARLEIASADGNGLPSDWRAVLARRRDAVVGYAGIVTPPGAVTTSGDVALDRSDEDCGPVLAALLGAAASLSEQHGAERVEVWLRHATAADVACAENEGYRLARRLAVLARDLDDLAPPDLPGDLVVRQFEPGTDEAAVVTVLAAAYGGTDDAGWDAAKFAARQAYDWFEPGDLLLALDTSGEVMGLHWTKRRSPRVGEVYNLAVAPQAQGRRVGGALLDAGLHHLRQAGCEEVLLWVDRANEPALRLYRSRGFTTRWEDVALARTLP